MEVNRTDSLGRYKTFITGFVNIMKPAQIEQQIWLFH